MTRSRTSRGAPPSAPLIAVLSLFATVVHAQDTPAQFNLGEATGRIDRGFSQVTGAAELRDGRLIITDARELGVFVLDFSRRTVTPLGRTGPGPDEYGRPFAVLRAPGDTLIIASPGGRFLRVDPAGNIAGPVPFPVEVTAAGMSIPRAIDTAGRYYWASDFLAADPQRGTRRNRTPSIRRWTPGHDSAVVVASYADHAAGMTQYRLRPYAERDAWVVTPDGRVGVLVAADYHLRWMKDGRIVAEGRPIPFQPIPIGPAERAAYREARAGMPAAGVRIIGADGNPAQREEARRRAAAAYPDEVFPPALPPFEEQGVWLSPRGDIWVARARAAKDAVPTIDVIDAAGALRGSLRLPLGRRVLKLERNGIYLVYTDDDGLQWVERYAWPSGLGQ